MTSALGDPIAATDRIRTSGRQVNHMGWTHSWQRPTELPEEGFARAVEDCRKVMGALGVTLGGFTGEGDPVFSAESIVFNGAGRSGCEPFEIARVEFDRRGRDMVRSFCKTEHAPYDVCVQAALIVLKHHLGDAITVGSDGGDSDWKQAREHCQETLGYGGDFSLAAH